jgi:hypothetical protein
MFAAASFHIRRIDVKIASVIHMKFKTIFSFFAVAILIAAAVALALGAGQKKIAIAEGGRSSYRIVLPENATRVEEYAARELRTFLKRISGAELPVVYESGERDDVHSGPGIYIGRTRPAFEAVGATALDKLGREGFILKTVGRDLIIAGGGPRGTLYGVYGFLEDHLGCRWYAPDAEFIPSLDRIVIMPIDEIQRPAFEYREPFFQHAFDGTWAIRNRTNGNQASISAEQGGHIQYSHFVHTLYSLVPPGKYFKDHPEYFSEIDGVRKSEHAQLCLTNPEVLRIATAQVLKWIEDAPDATIFSVSQNDSFGYCMCPKCRAIDEAEGTPMGTLLRFVNAIADEVAKKHPDKIIDTLAYQYSEKPPKTIRPRPNVVIRLCHMQPSCDLHPLEKCFMNKNYVRNLKNWNKLTDRIFVWHYVTNFAHYVAPFPDLNAIVRDIPFYQEHGVKGYFGQGSYQSPGGDMAEIKAWVIAKLLWNPSLDPGTLINDFMHGYFGPASPPIMKYYLALQKRANNSSVHAHLYSGPTAYLTGDLIKLGEKSFDEAEAIAAGDPALLKRVRRARLPVTYVELTEPHLLGWKPADMRAGGPHDQFARLGQFEKDLAEFNVTNLEEWQGADKSLETIRKNLVRLTTE